MYYYMSYTCIYIYIHIHMCLCVCVCVYIYIYIYIYTCNYLFIVYSVVLYSILIHYDRFRRPPDASPCLSAWPGPQHCVQYILVQSIIVLQYCSILQYISYIYIYMHSIFYIDSILQYCSIVYYPTVLCGSIVQHSILHCRPEHSGVQACGV